ncbi:hypothetical protein GJ496_003974 [Pomphorhynchus laevis]|nr:hypothetical protein GJ496_003974 [Pomphorhynchus laevis]
MDPKATSRRCPSRRVPFALRSIVEEEIQRQVNCGILEPVDHSNSRIDWATPIVTVRKQSGGIRLCGNFRVTINPFLQVESYVIPTWEEITTSIADIQYIRGTENVLADILSRFAIEEYQVESSEEESISLMQEAALIDLQLKREQIRNESLVDPELKQIRRYLESEWPNGCNQWRGWNTVVAAKDCDSDFVTSKRCTGSTHTGHPGINTMKELARRYCWWPSIEADIEHTVRTCQLCLSSRNAVPTCSSFTSLGCTNATMGALACRLCRHWPEIEEIINTSASETIKKLRSMLSRMGIPKHIVSDNGPPFTSREFRIVDMSEGNLELTLAQFLMTYRNTKQSSTGVSPAVLMFGRRLSSIWDRLRPNIQTTVQSRRESVWLRDTQRKRWEPGYIMSKNGSESYSVDTPDVSRRRHANDIRNSPLHQGNRHVIPGSIVQHKCHPNYIPDTSYGHMQVQCLPNGQWSKFPQCTITEEYKRGCVNTPDTNLISRNHLITKSYHITQFGGQVFGNITYTCEDNYEPLSPNEQFTVSCLNSVWTKLPVCKPQPMCSVNVDLPQCARIVNRQSYYLPGKRNQGYLPGSYIEFVCAPHAANMRQQFSHTHTSKLLCESRGTWRHIMNSK